MQIRRSSKDDAFQMPNKKSKRTVYCPPRGCIEGTESECACVSLNYRKCEINGCQLSLFYRLWTRDNKRTLGKPVKLPRFMKRTSNYRQCGRKTREYEKRCANNSLNR